MNTSEEKNNAAVRAGSSVEVLFEDGRTINFRLDSKEVDPSVGIISPFCPIGKALMGARSGEEREYVVNGKIIKIRIQKVDEPAG